jgi:glycosyltransferase involved in cell wall biosynthesis
VSNDDLLLALWQHAGVYFHGHSVGGTNPALVQAMAAGAPVLARDTVYNREVLGSHGEFVAADPAEIVEMVQQLMADKTKCDEYAEANIRRAKQHYSWTKVCIDYERALRDLVRH